jgi:hypothetical protein
MMKDLRFSWQYEFRFQYFGFLHYVVFLLYTNITEKRAVFNSENGSSMFVQSHGMQPEDYTV